VRDDGDVVPIRGAGDPLVLKGHEDYVGAAAWSPDGKRIVTASFDFTARVWNADGAGDPLVLKGHEGSVPRPNHARLLRPTPPPTGAPPPPPAKPPPPPPGIPPRQRAPRG